ncbi:RagB/SusD family nutrient uptake outer membrane protein [Flavobacterium sp. I3-2]|uniref:RagB/SusD family nutrient uptake outer membrane protein n=1 Tax=Flavobacterium sp. I3-2 TaxID=2748319 RepID=UPI0015AD5BF6|nr:RagB/SusD family nutrient uptake outer membrane protein [Flavobacterium sp. I3-2]
MKKIIIKISLFSMVALALFSCSKDSLEPELSVDRDLNTEPLKSESDLDFVANGMYKKMRDVAYYGRDYIIFNEARTDDAYSIGSSNRFVTVSEMRVNIGDAYSADTWIAIYKTILNANLIINANEVVGDQDRINDYKGQALVARSMGHFDLLKLYGQQHIDGQGGVNALAIPYVTYAVANSEEALGVNTTRKTFAEVRNLIYQDLDEAIDLITLNTNKVKITKQMALGLKSRVALYFATFYPEDYQVALDAANDAIAEGGLVIPEASFASQFTGNIINVNSVFELSMPSNDNLGNESLFEIYNGNAYGDIVAQSQVTSLFDPTDIRLTIVAQEGANLRNVGKYTTYSDNVVVMRLEEIILNAAEASAHISPANVLGYLNQIRAERGVSPLTTATLNDVLLERRKELMFEGFRFDDLMRLRMTVPSNPRMTEIYPYGHFRIAFPIPLTEINASAMTQNEGY